ncbi:hypothetical protein ACFQZE_10910 [Paenibacillus sp. GCM10027627]|uniref:hypothetical protein n=1 Tax=unclassified Paenibacillus TaxID=185978 RepID=UPI0036271E64
MNEADDAFDMIIMIMTVAVFVPIMIYCSIPFFKGEVGGFNVQIEKTAMETQRELIVEEERPLNTHDVLLMLAVADRFTPGPSRVNMNVHGSLDMPIDESFLLDKAAYIQLAKQAMPNKINVDMKLYAGPTGVMYWNVTQRQP